MSIYNHTLTDVSREWLKAFREAIEAYKARTEVMRLK